MSDLTPIFDGVKPEAMYCEEVPHRRFSPTGGTYLAHFFHSPLSVKMCGDGKFPIFEVVVTKGTDLNGYWGWWEAERQGFLFVYPSRPQLEMCFTYGSKIEEERGKGKMMPVDIKIIREVKL
jgi:hypothetical protein